MPRRPLNKKQTGQAHYRRKVSPTPSASKTFDRDRAAEEILQHCVHRLHVKSGSIFLMDRTNERLRLVKATGPRENHHCGKSIQLGEGISGYVAARRRPLLVANLSEEKELVQRKRRYPVDSFMSCPVLKGSSVLAVINLAGREGGRPFSQKDLRKLQALSKECTGLLIQSVHRGRQTQSYESLLGDDESQKTPIRVKRQPQKIDKYEAAILDCLSQYVLVFDHRFKITYCSKEKDLIHLFGQRKGSKFLKQNILALPFHVERNKLSERLKSLLHENTPFSLNDVRVEGSPQLCVVNMFFSPFFSIEGNPLGGLLLLEDNTKNFEMRRRLVEAEKFSVIGSLTSMITHEVNNPLDGAMRLINISVSKIEADDPVKAYLSEAQKGLRQIASLVGSLASFSRRSIRLNREVALLNRIIESAISVIRNRVEDKDITLHLELAPENPGVRANDFYQVVNNLLSNAFDAVISGQGEVRVETRLDGKSLHVIVEDNGCGIPKQMQSRIFKAFCTTKEPGRGTGLGLAIVKKIVDKYDGTIEVVSEETVGTKMRLTFPRDKLNPR